MSSFGKSDAVDLRNDVVYGCVAVRVGHHVAYRDLTAPKLLAQRDDVLPREPRAHDGLPNVSLTSFDAFADFHLASARELMRNAEPTKVDVCRIGLLGWAANVSLSARLRTTMDKSTRRILARSETAPSCCEARAARYWSPFLTTMAGFAGLLVAEYGALTTIGVTMVIGVGTCGLFCLAVLPALLVLLGRAK